jgi:protease II
MKLPPKAEPPQYIPLPSLIGSIEPGFNLDYESTKVRYKYSSCVLPDCVYDYDFESKEAILLHRTIIGD